MTSYDDDDDDPDMDASARCAHCFRVHANRADDEACQERQAEQRDEMIEARSKRDASNPTYLSAGHEWRFDPERRRYVCRHCRAEGILDRRRRETRRGKALSGADVMSAEARDCAGCRELGERVRELQRELGERKMRAARLGAAASRSDDAQERASLASAWPTTQDWLNELAHAASQLAGLNEKQQPGLLHLFSLVYERGYEDGCRDADKGIDARDFADGGAGQ